MVTFIVIFLGIFSLLSRFISALLFASDGFTSLMVLMCLGFGALALFTHARWAWAPCCLCLLGSVALEILAPFASMIEILGAMAIAGYVVYIIKREVNAYIMRDAARPATLGGPRLSPAVRTLIRWI